MNTTLRLMGLLGALLFGLLLATTFISPKAIEQSAKSFVQYTIEADVRAKQGAVNDSAVASKALNIAKQLGLEKHAIHSDMQHQLPQKIANVIAAMCGYDCEKKKAVSHAITSGYLERIKNIELAQDTLGELIKGKYIEIVGKLKLDLRIFLGSNLAMFLILLVVSWLKPQALTHLFVPALLLLVATVVSSCIYIIGQDWFYTILYNDYMGFAYLGYIAAIFSVLVDIVLNKARATTEIINGMANAVGSAFSVAPC